MKRTESLDAAKEKLAEAEKLARLLHLFIRHHLDEMLQYGDVAIEKYADRWYMDWKEMSDYDQTYFIGWALRIQGMMQYEASREAEEGA